VAVSAGPKLAEAGADIEKEKDGTGEAPALSDGDSRSTTAAEAAMQKPRRTVAAGTIKRLMLLVY
jgi:hypothetical protein